MERSPGVLIGIEGIDGVGKGTQSSALSSWLRLRGQTAQVFSFPDYSTPIGAEIRRFLEGARTYPAEVRHMLFAANRWEKRSQIESALRKPGIVIVNRYSESNLAYGTANGLNLSWLMGLESGLPRPELVIVLDAPSSTLNSRRSRRKDEYEKDADLQEKTRAAYLRLAGNLGWRVVDATGSIEDTTRTLAGLISTSLEAAGRTV